MLYKMSIPLPSSSSKRLKDIAGIAGFLIAVIVGAFLINQFVFRSFNVEGPSMENTLKTGDRLIVNRLPVTWARLRGNNYVPERGQIIVFKNPKFEKGLRDEYIVKRVIAFPGERVSLNDGKLMVYNKEFPAGLDVDAGVEGPQTPSDGYIDLVVPEGEVFVAGDHRQSGFSYDSRNGLGTIPFYDIIGPVWSRIFPFDSIRTF